ncbi:hypothetical protein UlMin_022308 [Ulmus minor]
MAPPWIQELHFPHIDIPITIDHMVPVKPAGPIPVSLDQTLYLSNLDNMIGCRVFTPTIYFYTSSGQKPVITTLRDALARILVPYYPLSGRLRETKNGKLEVFFGEEQGALMVEAHSELALADLGVHAGVVSVPNPGWTPLIFRFPNEEPYKILDMPLLIVQLTLFSCGGFSIGLRLCHCICDGIGAMQFISAWAATAKEGRLVTNPKPCWDREIFRPRDPPMVKFPHNEFMKIEDGSTLTTSLWEGKLVQKCYRISRHFQDWLKTLAQSDEISLCSTFDAMAAHIWRCWVKALDVKPLDYELRLTFSVNARPKLQNPPLKEGFYGNVVVVACVKSTVSELIHRHLPETTRLVREARQGVSEEYLRSTADYVEVDMPRRLEFGGKLTITQWTRFSLYDSGDFGWGKPAYAGPIDLTPTPQVCVLLPEGESDPGGAMVVCICLPEFATRKFTELLCLVDSSEANVHASNRLLL